jgi:hypothetical protein
MISLDNEAEETAFYNHDSDRAVAVLWPAIVENRLTDLLRATCIPSSKDFDDLFGPGKPIGDFGLKIKTAYIIGAIHKDIVDDLRIIAKIRNAFAHKVDITSFEQRPISRWMDNLHSIIVHRRLLDDLKTHSEKDETKICILEGELIDYRNKFHCSIRYLIHRIVALERKRRAFNEELVKAGYRSPEPETNG